MSDLEDRRDVGAFIPAALDDYGLDPTEFRVYARIVRRAGADGHYESAAAVAAAIGVGERTVREALALLRTAGLVTCEKRPGATDLYRLTPTSAWVPSGQLAELRAAAKRPRRTNGTPVPTTAVPGTGRSDGPGGPHDRGPQDRTPRSPGPDTPVPRTDEGSPTKGIPQGEGETSSPPVAASCDLVELTFADGQLTEIVDAADPSASFVTLWTHYPRHPKTGRPGGGGDRPIARDRWGRLTTRQRRDALERLGWYLDDLAATGTQPKHLSTWIARRSWETYDGPPGAPGDGLDPFELAVAAVCGRDPARMTGDERALVVTCAAALTRAGADETQLRDVARRWSRERPDIPVTEGVLLKHWTRFAVRQHAGGPKAVTVCTRCRQPKDDQHTPASCAEILQLIGATA